MTTSTLSYELQKTIRLLPGYDPFAQAGDCTFNEEAAGWAIGFVQECCTHVKGEKAGTPLLLEPWQQAIFANLYGWYRPDGLRRYREGFIFIARGNSKTTMAAAIVCCGLYVEDEPGAEIYSSAAEREQARLCFEIVTGMIRNERYMAERANLYKYSIVVGDKSYKAISAEAGSKHGYNAQLVVNDELHAHRTPELTEVLQTGTGKRRQPLVVHLTTSDYEREGSICNRKHDYASKVRDGVIDDPAFLPVIYEAAKDDDWTDPKVWAKANPNLGISVPEQYLVRECEKAKDDPAYENTFKRLHLNIRTAAFSRWITSEAWDACRQEMGIVQFAGQKCWCGLDLASTQDFTACVVAFRTDDGAAVFPYFWVPEETARKREQSARIPYSVWARDGHLNLTPGRITDYDIVRSDINAVVKTHKLNVQEIAADQLFQGLDICRRLADEDGYLVFAHGMGILGLALPTKETKRLILGGQLQHDGNPILRWMMSNVVVQTDAAGNEKPARDKCTDKIDGVVAMIMATGRAVLDEQTGSIYDTQDVKEISW